ncbi:MAG: YjbF family lipoprotein [Rhizomicrobium sp.]
MAAALAAGTILAGCSSDNADWSNLFRIAVNSWKTRDAAVSLDRAAAIPYATLGIRIDGGPEQILVLATDVAGERLWASSAKVAILTKSGRIVSTSGFGTDLTAYHPSAPDANNALSPGNHVWTGDFADIGQYSVQIQCIVSPGVPDPISILGAEFQTLRIDESCQSDHLKWRFTNSYWLTPNTNRIWKAIQHIHPKGPEIQIELLRPPDSPQ